MEGLPMALRTGWESVIGRLRYICSAQPESSAVLTNCKQPFGLYRSAYCDLSFHLQPADVGRVDKRASCPELIQFA